MTNPLLTPQQIAERLQIKVRTAYDYLAPGGRLHHLRKDIGPKIIRVDPEAFENWIKNANS